MPAYLCRPEPGLLAAVRAPAQWTWQLFFCIFADKKQSTSLRYREISPKLLGIVGETIIIPLTLLFEWASKLLCALFYSNPDLLTCPLSAGSEAQGFQWHFIIWVYSTLISAHVLSALFFLHCFFLPHRCLESSCCSSVGNGLSCGPASEAYVKSETISGVQILWWLLESWEMCECLFTSNDNWSHPH